MDSERKAVLFKQISNFIQMLPEIILKAFRQDGLPVLIALPGSDRNAGPFKINILNS